MVVVEEEEMGRAGVVCSMNANRFYECQPESLRSCRSIVHDDGSNALLFMRAWLNQRMVVLKMVTRYHSLCGNDILRTCVERQICID
jgi:hypothetical protein